MAFPRGKDEPGKVEAGKTEHVLALFVNRLTCGASQPSDRSTIRRPVVPIEQSTNSSSILKMPSSSLPSTGTTKVKNLKKILALTLARASIFDGSDPRCSPPQPSTETKTTPSSSPVVLYTSLAPSHTNLHSTWQRRSLCAKSCWPTTSPRTCCRRSRRVSRPWSEYRSCTDIFRIEIQQVACMQNGRERLARKSERDSNVAF